MNIYRAIKEEMLVPIHPAGWPFIGLFVVITVIIGHLFEPFFWIGVPASLWCVYFFRNPPRVTPSDPLAVIAPADGRVLSTEISELPPELNLPDGEWRCISIFMNVFDVHVNRSPIQSVVFDSHYIKGAFVNASLDKANKENERLALVLETGLPAAPFIGCVQIAGLVARRILCEVDVADRLNAGQIYGLIRFGSRVDVWVPAACTPMVLAGQRTLAGETILTKLPEKAANNPKAQLAKAKTNASASAEGTAKNIAQKPKLAAKKSQPPKAAKASKSRGKNTPLDK